MLINLRNALMAGKRWKNPYVTDGLVAMWDGEWNAGGGIHDPNATTWGDISENGHDIALTAGSFGAKSFICDGRAGFGDTITSDILTIEFVGKTTLNSSQLCAGLKLNPSNTNLYRRFIGFFSSGTALQFGQAGPRISTELNTLLYGAEVFTSATDVIGTLYKNGLQTTSIGSGSGFTTGGEPRICIGGVANGPAYPFKGEINRISIYSRALSASEIAANYAIDKARFGLP